MAFSYGRPRYSAVPYVRPIGHPAAVLFVDRSPISRKHVRVQLEAENNPFEILTPRGCSGNRWRVPGGRKRGRGLVRVNTMISNVLKKPPEVITASSLRQTSGVGTL